MLFIYITSTGVLLVLIVTTTWNELLNFHFRCQLCSENVWIKDWTLNELPLNDELFYFRFHYKQEEDNDTLYCVR